MYGMRIYVVKKNPKALDLNREPDLQLSKEQSPCLGGGGDFPPVRRHAGDPLRLKGFGGGFTMGKPENCWENNVWEGGLLYPGNFQRHKIDVCVFAQ